MNYISIYLFIGCCWELFDYFTSDQRPLEFIALNIFLWPVAAFAMLLNEFEGGNK